MVKPRRVIRAGESPDEVAVFEGTALTFKLAVRPGPAPRQGRWLFTYAQEGGAPREEVVPIEIPGGADGVTADLTLPPVSDGADRYGLSVALDVPGEAAPADVAFRFGVYPQHLTIKPTYGPDAQGARFRYDLHEAGAAEPRLGLLVKSDHEGYVRLRTPGPAEVRPHPPWRIDSWKDGRAQSKLREPTVSRARWVAALYEPTKGTTAEAPHKQYVNLPRNPAMLDIGRRLPVVVGPKEDEGLADPGSRVGIPGDLVHVKLVLDAGNTPRTWPAPGLLVDGIPAAPDDPNARPLTFSKVVPLGPDGTVRLEVDCGVSGGDRLTVKVGLAADCADDALHIQTWRLLGLESFVPEGPMRLPCPGVLADGGSLDPALVAKVNEAFAPAFLEVMALESASKLFDAVELDRHLPRVREAARMKVAHMTWPSEFIDFKKTNPARLTDPSQERHVPAALPAGKTVFVAPMDALRALEHLRAGRREPYVVSIRWCDLFAEPHVGADSITGRFEADAPVDVESKFHVFPVDVLAADGSPCVRSIEWKVTKYKDGADWKPLGPGTPTPGAQYVRGLEVERPAADELAQWLTMKTSRTVSLKLPARAGRPDDPGHHRRKEVALADGSRKIVEFLVAVRVKVKPVGFSTLGGMPAIDPRFPERAMLLCTRAGTATTIGMANTIVHELGHALGLCYVPAQGLHGRLGPIPGIAFGKLVPDGPYYFEHGDDGNHCAAGLVKAQADTAQLDYQRPAEEKKAAFAAAWADHCVMFGHGDAGMTQALAFCPDCLGHLKATDCASLDVRQ